MLNVADPVMIYPDTRKALSRLRLRLLCFALPVVLLYFALLSLSPVPLDSFTNFLRWCLLAEIPFLYLVMSRKLTRQTKPIVSLSSQGMTIHTLYNQIGFLRWDEIKDVYAYNLGYRLVGVSLKDPKTVYERIGLKRSWMLRMNSLSSPLYKLSRMPMAHINIPQEYLPMTADELLTQIQAYRAIYA